MNKERSYARKAIAGFEMGGTKLFDVYGAGALGKLFGNPSQVSISGDEAAPADEAAPVDTKAPVDTTAQVVRPLVKPVVKVDDDVLKVGPEIANKLINAPPNIAQDLPKKKDYFKLLEEKLTEDKSGISSQDKYMALLQASLGTMAAASQPGAKFLGSIGQGGMAGIKQIEDARVLRAKERASDIDAYAKLAEIQQKSKEKKETQSEKTDTFNAGRIQNSISNIGKVLQKDPNSATNFIVENFIDTPVIGTAVKAFTNPNSQIVKNNMFEGIDAILTLGTGAAYNKEQRTAEVNQYMPLAGESDEVKKGKLENLINVYALAYERAGSDTLVNPDILRDQFSSIYFPNKNIETKPKGKKPDSEFRSAADKILGE